MYVKVENGSVEEYPYTIRQLRRDNPRVSFPKEIADSMLSSYGVYPVTVETEPSYTPRTQTISQNSTPTLSNGAWTLGWTVSSKTSDEIQAYDDDVAEGNRIIRNQKLAETDFYALSDVTMSAAMATYRQALRDITTHANWPNLADDDWPTKP